MAQNNWLDEGSTPVPQPTSAAADTSWLDEQSDVVQDNALVRGFKKSSQSIGITKGLVTGDSADTARKVAEAADYARKNPGTKEGAELMDAWNRGDGVTGGVTEVAGEFAKDWRSAKGFIPGVRATAKNLQAMGSGIVEQVPNMIAPVAGMIAGGAAGSAAAGPVGTVLGGWAGASLGNTAVEGGSMVQEALQKDKIDPTDQAAVRAYLDKNGDRILGQAGVKGAIIGAVDTATAGLGHFLLSGPGKAAASRALADMGVDAADKAAVRAAQSSAEFKNRIASDAAYQATQQGANKIARNAGAAALEPAGEFAGEFVGQGVATGEWDAKNAALEAASSIGQSGAMYAGQKAIQAFSRPGAATNDPSAQPAPAPGQPSAAAPANPGTERIQQEFAAQLSALQQQEQGDPTVPQTTPPDGAAALAQQRAQAEAQRQAAIDASRAVQSPDDEIYQSTGMQASQDVTRNEKAAPDAPIDPVREQVAAAAQQGGALSGVALTAIDTGVTQAMQPAPEQAPPQISLEEADARDQAAYEQFFANHDAEPVVSRYYENDDDIPDFGAASNVSDEEFLRSLGATDEDIQDAIATARQSPIPQSSPAVNAGTQANEPAGPREGAGGNQAAPGQGQVTLRQPENFTGTPSATMGKQGATARPGPAFGLKDALAQIRTKKQQEAANAPAAQEQAPAAAPVPGPAAATAVEADGPAPDIKAITAKQIPDMTDGELQQAIAHYGPEHKRTAKLQKEVQRRAAQTTQGSTNATQAAQAQQASPQPAQAGAAPAAAPGQASPATPAGASTVRALNDGAPAENPGAQAAPAAGAQAQAQGSEVEALRQQLRDVEDRILAAAPSAMGQGGGDIEAAMKSRKVPVTLKAQRTKLKEQLQQSQGSQQNQQQAKAQQAQAATENVANDSAGQDDKAIRYELPPEKYAQQQGDESWMAAQSPSFKPTARQQLLMDAVAKALDDGAFYNRDVDEHVAQALGVTPEQRARNSHGVEGGDFGFDVYNARKAVEAQRSNAKSREFANALNLKPGDVLGTLVFNDGKVTTGVTIKSLNETGLVATIAGKRGAAVIEGEVGVDAIASALDRAKERGKRKDGYADFVAERSKPSAVPAVVQAAKDSGKLVMVTVGDKTGAAPAQNQDAGNTQPPASAPASAQKPAPKKKPSADQTRAKADALTEREKAAKAKMLGALGKLAALASKNTRMNWTPEEEQKLLPIVIELFDGAIELGAVTFQKAVAYVRDFIAQGIDQETADAIPFETLQGAYIAVAGRHKDKGVTAKKEVAGFDSLEELQAVVEPAPTPVADTEEKADTDTKDAQNANPDTTTEPGQQPAIAAGTGVQDGKPGKVRGNAGGVRGGNAKSASGNVGRGPNENAGTDYVPGPEGLTRTGSWFETAKRNIDLIELAIKIDSEKRPATPQEQDQLAKYVGFGASAIRNDLFPIPGDYAKRQEPNRLIWPNLVRDARWKPLAERIEALPREWQQSILQSSQYAHYTSEGIIRSVWSALDRMGFKGGNVFEPGMGIGSFAMLMPNDVRAQSRYTGIEFDGPTALIAGLLSPQQNMIHGDFIKRKFPKNFFDVNVGNPPFAQTKIYGDPDYAKNGFMLHDFFFAKGIDLVRPGGLQVFVTSKGTMDKQSDKARKYLAERADLLGAIRLPSTAFEGNAGTSVVTDVIFLKKRAPGEAPGGHPWSKVATVETPDGPVVVNEYFASNPHMVLGQQRISGNVDDEGRRINSNGMGGEKYTVVSYDKTPAELDAKFAAAVQKLPAGTYAPQAEAQAAAKPKAVDFDPAVKREGVIYLGKDGALMRVDEGVGKPLAGMVNLSEKEQAWFKSYVALRDKVQAARFDQLNDGPWEKSLSALNKAYDAFRKEHGPVKDFRVMVRKSTDEDGKIIGVESRIFKNRKLYREDYDNALITSLEEITEDGDIVKAPFLKGRTIGKPVERVVRSIGDALAVSLDEIGSLNLEDVGQRLGLSREEAIEALGDQVYLAPTGEWQLADEYLSGDVVAKLEEAEQAAQLRPELRRNVQALKDVQPEKLGPSQISAKLGASWIPESHVNEFAVEIGAGAVTFDPRTETWQVDGGNLRSQRTAGDEYGTAARSPSELLEAVLNSRSIKVTKSVDKKTVTDEAATTAANEVAKKIKDKFKGWVWTDTDRSTELVERYNQQFNNIAPRRFDGSHLTLPGVSLRFKLHPHQLRAIWRMVQTGNTYLAHAVGAGKTIEMIAGGMEQKRLGLIKKPIYVVPNHMLEQFSNEFMELYPMANIMVADDENFSPERRKAFVAAATLNNPDAIVITHDAFQRIGVKEESVAPIRDEILADLEIELSETAKSNETRVRRSQLEQQIEAVKQRFDRIIGAGAKDSTVKFEDMGVDFVFADEAHVFRKLDFHTAQQIKGIDPNGSKRALDMYVKTRILDGRNPGRSMVFASGTPVTNTMGELYTIMRFFAGDALDKAGISTFDAWARQFGEVAPALEPNAAGKYELIERFAKFDNVPELMSRVRQFMDVLTSDNLGALVKRPDIKGGKPNLNITEPNKALQEYMKGELARRIEISKAWKPSKDEPSNPDPIVAIITDGRFAALDPRFFGGKLEAGETSLLMDMGKGVVKSYHATKDNVYQDKAGNDEPIKGSTQLVFYNLGFGEQSQKSRGFNSRAAFTKILTDGGIPRGEIYWFDDANTDAKKEAVFKDMRNGKVKVLIGSAKKMGTGVNVQKRLAVLHYQDPPWFPADVEQPHGRIIRQGNQNAEGAIEWYTTKGTYQSTMWQMVGRKQRFIDQAFTGDKNLRSMDDLGEASLFEQAAAVASGDPRAIQLAGLRQDVERFERLQASHASEQINVASSLRSAQWGVDSAKKRIATYTKAFAAIGERYFAFSEGKVGNATYTKPGEFGQAIKDAFNKTAADAVMAGKPVKDKPIATIGDAITIYMDEGVSEGKGDGQFELSVSFGGMNLGMGVSSGMGADVDATGLARRVFNKINSVDQDLRAAKDDLVRNEVDVNKLRKKLGAPFEYQQEMAEKYAELKRLEAELKAEGQAPAKPAATAITTDDTLTPQAEGESTNRMQTGAPEANTADVVYSSADSALPTKPLSLNRVNQLVQEALAGIRGAPPVEVTARPADVGLQVPAGSVGYGVTLRSGDIYVFQSAMGSDLDVFKTVFHELFHRGVRVLVPKGQYVQTMLDLAKGDSRIQQLAIEWKNTEMGQKQKENLREQGYTGAELTGQYEALAIEEALAAVAEEIKAEGRLGSKPKNMTIRFLANWLAKLADLAGMKKLAQGIRNMSYNEAERFVMSAIDRSGEPVQAGRTDNLSSADAPAGDQTQTEAFKRWFKDSAVVDADGKPLVMYHGTRANFNVFGNIGGRFSMSAGYYFASSTQRASVYADGLANAIENWNPKSKFTKEVETGANVMPVYLSIKNPLVITNKDGPFSSPEDAFDLNGGALVKAAKDLGHDGVIYRREKGDGFDEIAAVAFRPEQVKSAIGNNGDFDPANADIRFRSADMASRAGMADLTSKARDELNKTFGAPGKLSWWHKTVGTMFNLAERSPAFKRVFDSAQGFVDDVSYYATDAAELAPRLLPKLETWRDIFKRPITTADNAAVAKPVFEGTLDWARDESGKPVRLQTLIDAAEKLTPQQKAQRLLRNNKISEGMLKAWQGLPLEQYEKLVTSRYESQMLQAGVVWTPAELKSLFKMTDAQVELYQEFRAATDRSLDTMARADMLRFGGKDVAELRDMVMDAKDVQDAAQILRDHLQMLAKEDPDRAGEISQLSSGMLDRAARVQELQEQGYAPLSRFGQYTVDVVDANGERQYFGLFETAREANVMAIKMRKEFGQDAVTQGTLSNDEFKLLAGITPESLELFGNMLGLESDGDQAKDQAFQEYLRRTKTNRSAMRRLIHRQGIAGYSEDVGRVLASFIYSNSRQTSAGLHMGELGEAITAIPKQQGELKDAAIQLSEYVKNPQEEAQAVRGLLFAQYLGGSIASAFVNMSQPAAVTFPWLSQFGGAKQAAAELGRAAKNLANRGHRYEADLAAALKHAEEEGTVSPQEVHQLMAQARGSGSLRPGDGTRVGDARAAAGNALTRLSLAWGKVFGAAEQVNRRMTFIAAYRVAKAQGMANPAAFAKKAVIETQFTYSKANKMKWGRGAVGATAMTFKTYSIAYLELLGRMWTQGGPEGKKAVLLALGMLMLMGGAGGLPFAEDAEDLVDGLAQLAGYNISSKKAKQELLESLFGEAGAGFVERGITGLPGMPLDVSGRLGMGNLLPATGLFKEKTDYTRDVLEVVGPVGDLAKRVASGTRSILEGDVGAGLLQMSPAAVRNAAKGADMAATGMYRDDKGYKVLDTSPAEAAMKAIGFQPASVSKVQEANFIHQQAKNFYNMQAQEIRAKWAKGIFEKDPALVAEARADLEDWNRKNPDQRIVVSMPAVLKRVREMGKTKDQRIADTAPKAMRQQLREEAAKARATL